MIFRRIRPTLSSLRGQGLLFYGPATRPVRSGLRIVMVA
jgi:hypothetical protein